MRHSIYLKCLAMVALPLLAGCQLISGVSGNDEVDAVVTSRHFDEIVTSTSPVDGEAITLDGHIVFTFNSEIELGLNAADKMTFAKVSNGDEIPFNADVSFNSELGAYQVTIDTADLLQPNTEYSMTIGDDFVFYADSEYQRFGSEHVMNFTTPKVGGAEVNGAVFSFGVPYGDQILIGGGTAVEDGDDTYYNETYWSASYDEGSSSWELDKVYQVPETLYNIIPITGKVVGEHLYAMDYKEESDDDISVIVGKGHMDGDTPVADGWQEVALPYPIANAPFLTGAMNIEVHGRYLYIPIILEDEDADLEIPYMIRCDDDVTACSLNRVWPDLGDDTSAGITDIGYCNGHFLFSGYEYDTAGHGGMPCAFILEGTTGIPPELGPDSVVATFCEYSPIPNTINSFDCTDDGIVATILARGGSAFVGFIDYDYETQWLTDIGTSGITEDSGVNGRWSFPVVSDGKDFVYSPQATWGALTLNTYLYGTGEIYSTYQEGMLLAMFTDMRFNEDMDALIAVGIEIELSSVSDDGGAPSFTAKLRVFDRRGNYSE
jgi:hypothetical protein